VVNCAVVVLFSSIAGLELPSSIAGYADVVEKICGRMKQEQRR